MRNRPIRLSTLGLLFVSLAATGSEQSAALRVRVSNEASQAVAGISILLSGPEPRQAKSDQTGSVLFDSLPAGQYDVTATGSGFGATTRTGVVVEPGTTQEISLSMTYAFAESVVVTARSERSLLKIPTSVTVVSSEQIEASAADNIGDLLRTVPGLNVVQLSARDINFNSRSGSGILMNSMLPMVNGRSIYINYFGAVFWDLVTVPPFELEQVDVLRSPGSSSYGPNALNGVINLTTKTPRQLEGGAMRVSVGEQGTRSAYFRFADVFDKWSYKVSAQYFQQDAWERDNLLPDGSPMPPTTVFENKPTKQPKFDVRADFEPAPGRLWSFRAGYAGATGIGHSSVGPWDFEPGAYYHYAELDHHTDDFDLKLYWDRFIAPYRLVLFDLPLDVDANTYVGEATWRRRPGAHDINFGGSVRFNRFDLTAAPSENQRIDVGAFFEDQLALTRQLSALIGVRVDKFDTVENPVIAPRVGLTYSPKSEHTFRFAYNRAYRAPSLFENYLDVDLPAAVPTAPPFFYFQRVLGSLDLEMEKMNAFEVGYTGLVHPRTTLFVTVYRQTTEGNIRFFPTTFFGPENPPPGWPFPPEEAPVLIDTFTFFNVGTVRQQGVEVSAHYQLPRLWMQGTYAFKALPKLTNEDFPVQLNLPPRHSAGFKLGYDEDRWSASFDLSYTDEAFFSDVLDTPFWGFTDAYVLLNAKLVIRPWDAPVDLMLSGTNLLDQSIKQHVFGDIIRRRILLGMQWQWD